MNYIFVQQRLLRAMIYGSGTAPLAHVHFYSLEWLVVKKVGNKLYLLQVDLVLIPTEKKACEASVIKVAQRLSKRRSREVIMTSPVNFSTGKFRAKQVRKRSFKKA